MIRKAIEQGELSQAQSKLIDFFDLIDTAKNELYVQTGRAHRIKEEEAKDIVSREELNREKNKISVATLYCCHKIEKSIIDYFPTIKLKVSSESLDNQIKLKFIDEYEQIEEIYRGDSAVFFKGKVIGTNRKVIIRVLRNLNLGQDPANLLNDIRLERTFNIKHRNIIKIFAADLKNFPRYLILEHISGISLDHLIGRIPFTLTRSVWLIKQLCDALYYLHINGIVHKNIKPDKILIDNELRPVISPFDIVSSRKGNDSDLINNQNLRYAAPELLKGEIDIPDEKCDQFSLGLLAYELITGTPLFYDYKNGKDKFNIQSLFEKRLQFFNVKKIRKKIISKLELNFCIIKIYI